MDIWHCDFISILKIWGSIITPPLKPINRLFHHYLGRILNMITLPALSSVVQPRRETCVTAAEGDSVRSTRS